MPPPPHPQSTPDVARSRSHRGAAGRLGGGTNCWCGTAAAQQPTEGWCPTWAARLGVRRSASSLRVIRRAGAGSPRTWPHSRASTWNSGRHAYEEASCGCATCTSTLTVAELAQRRASVTASPGVDPSTGAGDPDGASKDDAAAGLLFLSGPGPSVEERPGPLPTSEPSAEDEECSECGPHVRASRAVRAGGPLFSMWAALGAPSMQQRV